MAGIMPEHFLTLLPRKFQSEGSDPPPYQLHDEDTLVSDYFAALLTHFMWILGQNLGSGVGKAEIAFCLTVPSEWSETSRQNYLKDFQKSLKTVGLNTNSQAILVTESVSVSTMFHK